MFNQEKIKFAIKMLKSSKEIEHRENVDYLIKEVIALLQKIKFD